MTESLETVEQALELYRFDWNISQIARELRVSRWAVRDWINNAESRLSSLRRTNDHATGECTVRDAMPWLSYAYLLGQYLGDGCLTPMPRDVFKLRIATCDDYPLIRQRTVDAINAVTPDNKVGVAQREGCAEVYSHSKHWPCLFPQHGPGRKHERSIALEAWQAEIVNAETREFLAGLIHSDGCRCVNNIVTRGKPYSYPRYFFTNVSEDILMLCADAFDRLGVEWKRNRWNSLSVAKRDSVALLDTFIGPKT